MFKYFSFFLISILLVGSALAQSSFYIPRNILDAYNKNTRSFDGKPGERYWQNSSDYKINAEFDPLTGLLKGSEEITYYNNSPDTLKRFVIRLYQNMNKKESARDFNLEAESITDGVILKTFQINNKNINWNSRDSVRNTATNLAVLLSQPIVPNSSNQIKIQWQVQIPAGQNPRMGKYDSTSYFIAYWYPQVSVYDDIDGWDMIDYTGQHEMYNDFCNFDVNISVPNNFGIWATGELENASEVLNEKYLNLFKEAHQSDSVIRIVTEEDLKEGNIYKSASSINKWNYRAEGVPDFAFGISDHYQWDALSLVVDDQTGRRIYIAAAYNPSSKDFKDVAYFAMKSLEYYSKELPGVPFPFPSQTVFNGAGGMEFPMIVNNGSTNSLAGTFGVTSHELAHQYFPFYMGINERKYAWMDEGMAVFIPFDIQERMVEGNSPRSWNVRSYENFAGDEMELPLVTPSNQTHGSTYRTQAYSRPGISYDILRKRLGAEKFGEVYKEYINRWHGKHPIPYDFFHTFNEVSGKNLNWFWNPWFFENGYPDLSISDVKKDGNNFEVTVDKIGSMPVPIILTLKNYNGEILNSTEVQADVWMDGKTSTTISISAEGEISNIELGTNTIPDSNRKNNFYELK